MLQAIQKKYPSLCILKKFPDSGQKIVYLVKTEEYGIVMLKIIKEMNERILREINIMNNAGIPGVPHIYSHSSVNVDGKTCSYFFEEYIDGETLSAKLSRGALSLKESLRLFDDLLTIVECLENAGIVHRDIKPDNIICDNEGAYHLIDFGIARDLNLPSLTYSHAVVGPHTPGYAAPELFQYNKSKIDSRADLFSIGVVVYESIFGKHPFLTGNEMDRNEVWYKTITVTPENFVIPGDTDSQLIGLLQTLMKKPVTSRPPTAKKAHEWMRTVLTTLSI